MSTHTGRCLCGAVHYTIEGGPLMAGVCHCKNCQRQAGSAFSTLWGVPQESFHFTRGTPNCYDDADTDSGNTVKRYFCGDCGSPIYSAVSSQPDVCFVKTGTLDDTSGFNPQFQVWCDSKQDWVSLVEGVPSIGKS